jgi:asparagine synthase (glutamine-hydrolysing)
MCGIAGELLFTRSGPSNADWRMLSQMMKRRGPDDEGQWNDNRCTLVFRRLTILDLSPAGHQPMSDDSRRYRLVYNGELYNFKKLRKNLEQKGIVFKSTGDTEVVLYALREWGTSALEKFNGMFALAFYDTAEKKILLARDHAGIKPLYFLQTGQGVMFASQYNQILAHPWSVNQEISHEALGLYLRLGYIPAPLAMLENTRMLEPGEWIEITAEGKSTNGRHFAFPVYQEPLLSEKESGEALDDALGRAVKRQMVSDAPLGCFLSGGIDSPLIAALAQEDNPTPLKAFTLGITGDAMDESSDAIRYAREIGVNHHIKTVKLDNTLSLVKDVLMAGGEPFSDYSIIPTLLISQEAAKQVKVMLSGDGGDELFWGYTGRFGSVLDKSPDFKQPFWLRNLKWGMKKYLRLGNGYYNLRHPCIGDWYRNKHCRMGENLIKFIFPSAPQWPKPDPYFGFKGWDRDQAAQWMRWNEFLTHLTMVLLKVDRASMHHSLEIRVPFLDKEVIQTALNIKWPLCIDINNNIGKLPLRHCLKKRVSFQTRQKKGFEIPMGKWLQTSLAPLLQEYVFERKHILGLDLNAAIVKKIYIPRQLERYNYSRSLWLILSLSLWEKQYFIHRGAGHHSLII